jgi:hypothetical protein
LYTSSNIIPLTTSRTLRNAKDASHMAEKKNSRRVLVREPQEKGRLEDLRDHGRTLKQIFEEQDGQAYVGLMWLGTETSVGPM